MLGRRERTRRWAGYKEDESFDPLPAGWGEAVAATMKPLLGVGDGDGLSVGRTEVLDSQASVVEMPAGDPVEFIVLPDTQE